jgi:hypothetical protein
MEHPRWGRRQIHAEMTAHGFPMSEATIGQMLDEIRRHCPICGRSERHVEAVHVVWTDVRQMTGLLIGGPTGTPTPSGTWRRRRGVRPSAAEKPLGPEEDEEDEDDD